MSHDTDVLAMARKQLAIAAELVRAHGGDIKLVDAPQGATFRIAIPDQAAVSEPARRKEPSV